mmetsp:Transcript_15938/g.60744  ORF Transcript_15938/g.60744 Transcript_15938/m.60744 type:complete len:298 (-) Transcript_15938:72-965(-)
MPRLEGNSRSSEELGELAEAQAAPFSVVDKKHEAIAVAHGLHAVKWPITGPLPGAQEGLLKNLLGNLPPSRREPPPTLALPLTRVHQLLSPWAPATADQRPERPPDQGAQVIKFLSSRLEKLADPSVYFRKAPRTRGNLPRGASSDVLAPLRWLFHVSLFVPAEESHQSRGTQARIQPSCGRSFAFRLCRELQALQSLLSDAVRLPQLCRGANGLVRQRHCAARAKRVASLRRLVAFVQLLCDLEQHALVAKALLGGHPGVFLLSFAAAAWGPKGSNARGARTSRQHRIPATDQRSC